MVAKVCPNQLFARSGTPFDYESHVETSVWSSSVPTLAISSTVDRKDAMQSKGREGFDVVVPLDRWVNDSHHFFLNDKVYTYGVHNPPYWV
mmetsp:Transcript_20145/g.24066  ORF Transcript_20145/g.24066 Transcript_20145/m.24066 type:complete len:91 (-) Transcript_20145:2-274(-)